MKVLLFSSLLRPCSLFPSRNRNDAVNLHKFLPLTPKRPRSVASQLDSAVASTHSAVGRPDVRSISSLSNANLSPTGFVKSTSSGEFHATSQSDVCIPVQSMLHCNVCVCKGKRSLFRKKSWPRWQKCSYIQ